MKLQGIFVNAPTPFDYDGAIYRAKLEHNILKWSRTSVSGFVFAGTAGEGALLRESEKIGLWGMAKQFAPEGKLLIADVSSDGVGASATLAIAAAECGFDLAFARKPNHGPDAQLLYFRALADRSPLPLMIDAAPEPIEHPNIVTAKLAHEAGSLWTSLDEGATGGVLSFAAAAPYACITIWEASRTREREAALDWTDRIHPAAQLVSQDPAALKFAMELMGYYGGPPRLPLCPPDQAARREIEAAFRGLRG